MEFVSPLILLQRKVFVMNTGINFYKMFIKSVQFNILCSSQFIFWRSCLKLSLFLSLKNIFLIFIFWFLVFSFESLIAANIAKRSEVEVLIIPFLRDVSKTQFVKILSISVALDVVTLVGLLIKGIAPFSNMLLKNCLISEL